MSLSKPERCKHVRGLNSPLKFNSKSFEINLQLRDLSIDLVLVVLS